MDEPKPALKRLISFDDALGVICAAARPGPVEMLPLAAAEGRILARDVIARIDSPQRDLSAMDGFAVLDVDIGETGRPLAVIGKVFPGEARPMPLQRSTSIAVYTGSPVPPGADRVVPQELVQQSDGSITIGPDRGPSRHIRRAGSDFREGDTLLAAGTLLDYRTLVVAAAADMEAVSVVRAPVIQLFSTGDELVPPGCARGFDAATPESISLGISALARAWGSGSVHHRHLPDDEGVIRAAASAAVEGADCIVIIGGASVGERDHARRAFAGLDFEPGFSGVAMRPGKPAWFGYARGRPVLGLPGNPTAAMVVARLLLAPLVAGLSGRSCRSAADWFRMPIEEPPRHDGAADLFVRAMSLGTHARILDVQQASGQKALARADLLVRLRPGFAGPAPMGDALRF
jgi:molybdopterin molybdotransferase